MQVCICSNQYGERKQLERLFQRSADKLIASGEICYLHTYGSEGALLAEPMNFDLYMLDYQEDPGDVTGKKATALVQDLAQRRSLTTSAFYLAVPQPDAPSPAVCPETSPSPDATASTEAIASVSSVSPRIFYVKKPVLQAFVDEILKNRLNELKEEEARLKQALWEEENRPPKNLKERFYRWLNN
ncbi:MAG: hypothetical protein K5682_05175 [Lachnospiraceae bacterium]|nr:hypothetical protein [Lachnospiraceae bacterium]